MQFVKVFDNHKKAIVKLVVNENNKISYKYFRGTFPDAVGLMEMNESRCFSIPFDEDDNFVWNWNDNIVYDLIYSDRIRKQLKKLHHLYALFVFST
ncbi:unnamed protein product [Adineta steineri]|uniref:Uncharacterized protein n=1 Tax=Adineta steineri TaxID=433720 RepID=A0A814VAD3_9BILA|nr:unnamed protein product [Adineta steineri]CAF1381476.1 unnamed protein product [Adineta steineri]